MTAARRPGRVFLVGAGPGDPELLTLRAVRVLSEADVVLVDDLVDRRVLVHVSSHARIVDVGKRGGCKSTPQSYIEKLMVHEARAGRTVVRLKGGDPLLFGRGGEELDAARRAGIACEIVNGITSGLAAAAAVGTSLTRRSVSQGALFITGHAADGEAAPDWKALATSGMTLVVYMGVASAPRIARGLLDGGANPAAPVAVVERASCADERVTTTRLDALIAVLARRSVRSPAILVIGEAARPAGDVSSRPWPAANRRLRATRSRAARVAR
jgi:uroporphyrin-III C-methyltransferase